VRRRFAGMTCTSLPCGHSFPDSSMNPPIWLDDAASRARSARVRRAGVRVRCSPFRLSAQVARLALAALAYSLLIVVAAIRTAPLAAVHVVAHPERGVREPDVVTYEVKRVAPPRVPFHVEIVQDLLKVEPDLGNRLSRRRGCRKDRACGMFAFRGGPWCESPRPSSQPWPRLRPSRDLPTRNRAS
jgi:hypothetical protein